MRILAIRGENLASLGEPFLLDFEAEPLASTGLFAITGETGSGKSTILDTLCLALYGRYPRFAEQQQESSPDPGGRAKILDGSTILRRGAGQGHAEVDFLGHDNQRYRARWEARRSRGRADGAIQSAARLLYSLNRSAVTAMATSKTEVQDAVHRLTGLTFEQFCRTVLLAQGEFDSFLLAPERERGDLLEKITGTEIYGRISRRVREGTRALESQVEALETELTNLGLLNPTDHDALVGVVAALRSAIASKRIQTRELQQRLSDVDQLLNARKNLAEAAALLAVANAQWNNAASERALAMEWAAVESLRAPRERVSKALKAMPLVEELAGKTAAALQKAAADANHAIIELGLAQAEYDRAENVFKEFGPQWDEAAALDTELAHAEREANGASEDLDTAKATLDSKAVELAQISLRTGESSEELTILRENLGERNHQTILADRIQDIDELLGQYRTFFKEATEANEHLSEAKRNASKIEEAARNLIAKLQTDFESLQASESNVESLRQRLDAHDQEGLQRDLKGHADFLELLHEVQTVSTRYQTAKQNLVRSETELLAAQAGKKIADESQTRASAGLEKVREQRATLVPFVELAEESLAQQTVHLRSHLIDGEPCPVCGSSEHPYLEPGAIDALNGLAASLKAKREEYELSINHFTRLAQHSAEASAAARGTSTDFLRQMGEATRELELTQKDYSAKVGEVTNASNKNGLETPPETLADGVVESLASLEASCQIARTALLSKLSAVRELSNLHAQTRLEWERARRQFDQEQRELHHEREQANQARLAAASFAGTAEVARQRLASLEGQIQPFLTAATLTINDLRGDHDIIAAKLKDTAAELVALRAREAEIGERYTQLLSDRKHISALHDNAVERFSRAISEHGERLTAVRHTQESRALLLGGESTTEHRFLVTEARRKASEALDETRKRHTDAISELIRAKGSDRHAKESVSENHTEQIEAFAQYDGACVSAGFAVERANELLSMSPAVGVELRDQIEGLSLSLHAATAKYEGRQTEVEGFQSTVLETEDRESISLSLETCREEEAILNQDLGEKDARLQRNLGLRRTALDLQKQAQIATAELTDWREVDNAIGSPNGDRFRLFAQSLTLEQLIQLANVHLDTFSKRYHLARSPASDLALHVTDQDMGDEERPTRSLSGGERFLVSLSLALALSGLEGHDFAVDTLFIDEGFGSLDLNTLDIATSALETLHSQGRKVGVITHVAAMIESIPVQVKVESLGGGSSVVRVVAAPSFL